MTAFDLTALGIVGMALTGALTGFAEPRAVMAAAGEPGVPVALALEDAPAARTASVGFGGDRRKTDEDPAWASFPRAF
ncbi:hypothetical protein J5J86_21760 [Aquabacter sp. L1I39]|uniref:hypothetical protein n=1 Tax=Aquabacter sp. L1I39 TaxID=2820278 RepID=UPI001AD95762|nr:hypothetical protein [Aquabacter sp. L1I39]QTL03333.1 hypothetical protein J5J86_21760 [Aquabacter sp. L1I39]